MIYRYIFVLSLLGTLSCATTSGKTTGPITFNANATCGFGGTKREYKEISYSKTVSAIKGVFQNSGSEGIISRYERCSMRADLLFWNAISERNCNRIFKFGTYALAATSASLAASQGVEANKKNPDPSKSVLISSAVLGGLGAVGAYVTNESADNAADFSRKNLMLRQKLDLFTEQLGSYSSRYCKKRTIENTEITNNGSVESEMYVCPEQLDERQDADMKDLWNYYRSMNSTCDEL